MIIELILLISSMHTSGAGHTAHSQNTQGSKSTDIRQATGNCGVALGYSESRQVSITIEAGACASLSSDELKAALRQVVEKQIRQTAADAAEARRLIARLEDAERSRAAQNAKSLDDIRRVYENSAREILADFSTGVFRRDRLLEYKATIAERTTVGRQGLVNAKTEASRGHVEPLRAFIRELANNVDSLTTAYDRFATYLDPDIKGKTDSSLAALRLAEGAWRQAADDPPVEVLMTWLERAIDFIATLRDTAAEQVARLG